MFLRPLKARPGRDLKLSGTNVGLLYLRFRNARMSASLARESRLPGSRKLRLVLRIRAADQAEA